MSCYYLQLKIDSALGSQLKAVRTAVRTYQEWQEADKIGPAPGDSYRMEHSAQILGHVPGSTSFGAAWSTYPTGHTGTGVSGTMVRHPLPDFWRLIPGLSGV